MIKIYLYAIPILILILTGCSKKQQNDSLNQNNIQIPEVTSVTTRTDLAPNFKWKDPSGSETEFDSFRGKVTLVNFWATWCGPCKHELPALIALSKELADQNVVILGISTDRIKSDVPPFIKKQGIPYTVILSNEELEKAFGNIRVIPTTFLIDANGKIANTIVGSRTKDQFKDAILAVLEQNK